MKRYYKNTDSDVEFLEGNVIMIGTTSIVNPTEEQLAAAGWLEWVEPEPSDEEKLQRAKVEKLLQIDNYDSSSNVECFFINGVPMWLGHELRQQIKTSVEAYKANGNTEVTKIFNGMEFTFPCDTWLSMLTALEIYAAEALNTTERHKIAVNACTTVQEVIDYDYTTGYPAKLGF